MSSLQLPRPLPVFVRATFLYASAMLLLASPLTAQTSRTITYDDALRIALQRNVAVRIAQNAQATDAVSVSQSRMQFLPDLRANTQSSQNYGRNFNSSDGAIQNTTTQNVNAGLSSSVTLFDGMRNLSNYRQAQLTSTASEQDLARAQQTAIFTVASNYVAMVAQRELLVVREQTLTAQEAQERLVQAYVDAGSRPISDLYTQQASVASARLEIVQARRALELAHVDIMKTLQLDPAGDFTFVAPTLSAETSPVQGAALDSLIARALSQRADLGAGDARLKAADAGVQSAAATRWPTVALNLGYNTSYSSASQFSFADQFDQRRGGSIALGLSFPIFDRSSTSSAAQKASIQFDNARIALESQRQEVGLEVRRAWLDLESAREQLVAAEAQVRAADLALTSSDERYQAGVSTLVELANARTVQVQAASALVSARYNLVLQGTVMGYYVGDIEVGSNTLP
ncbi:MAG: TolC family protein [Gemmatimonadaceae bacterium]|nr:TolC family protein [Gemmatimonadaceae bacterium]